MRNHALCHPVFVSLHRRTKKETSYVGNINDGIVCSLGEIFHCSSQPAVDNMRGKKKKKIKNTLIIDRINRKTATRSTSPVLEKIP